MDYELIIGVDESGNEYLAVAFAVELLKESFEDAEVWGVDVYDEGAGVGLNFETEATPTYDEVMEMDDRFESFEELATASN